MAPEFIGPPGDKSGVPTVHGVMLGCRVFGVVRFDGDWMLTAAWQFNPEIDNPFGRSVEVAKCRGAGGDIPGHIPPDKYCMCGLYAFWTIKDLEAQHDSRHILRGLVQGYGRVFRASMGWRAERQQVLALEHPVCRYCAQTRKDTDAEWFMGLPAWLEPFDSERYDELDLHLSSPVWLCEKHHAEYDLYGSPSKTDERAIVEIPAHSIMKDLAFWYECDILPHLEEVASGSG